MVNRILQTVIFLLLLFVLAYLPARQIKSEVNDLPYIHYYDRVNERMVIERVDGSDSRAFDDVRGHPNWSPSGEWMILGETTIVSTDGLQRRLHPQAETSIDRYSAWSPNDDTLLLLGTNYMDGTIRIQLYDVATDTILAQTTVQYIALDPPYDSHLYWADDGDEAYVFWRDHLVTLNRNGFSDVRINRSYMQLSPPFDFQNGRLVHHYFSEDRQFGVFIQDVDSGRMVQMVGGEGFPAGRTTVRWSASQDYALVYARNCADDLCFSSLRLVDWQTGTVEQVSSTIGIESEFNNSSCLYVHSCQYMWSPSDEYAVLSDDNVVYLLTADTGEINEIARDVRYSWSPDGTLLLFDDDTLRRYNPQTNEEHDIPLPTDTGYLEFSPSPDGQLLGLPTNPPMIANLNGDIVAQSIRHSHSTNSISTPNYGYQWHPDGEWVLASYNIFFAGGGVGPSASVLFDLAGTTRRELPTSGNANFVPDRAIPHLSQGQATSVKKESLTTLIHTGDVTGVGWHPTDSTQLVTYSDVDGLTFWSLAGDEPTITNQIAVSTITTQLSLYQGVPLIWFADDNAIAYYDQGLLYAVETDDESLNSLSDISYPIFVRDSGDIGIGNSLSDEIIPVDIGDLHRSSPTILMTDLAGYIVVSDEVNSIPTYVDAETGMTTPLGANPYYYTADARANMVVFGAVYTCCIQVVDKETGNVLDEFFGTAHTLALSADAQRLATTSYGLTTIWDMSEYHSD